MFKFLLISLCFNFIYTNVSENCPQLISRKKWGARAPLQTSYIPTPVENVIIHHTVTDGCTTETECSAIVKNIQTYHMEKIDFDDIGYNFLIGGDGGIYEGAGWHTKGTHSKGYNGISLGLAFIGNFEENLPNEIQLRNCQKFLECAVERGELTRNYKLFGARQVRNTSSPGLKLYKELKKWAHYSTSPPTPGNSNDTIIFNE